MVFAALLSASKSPSSSSSSSSSRIKLASPRSSNTFSSAAADSRASISTPTASAPPAHGHEFILDESQLGPVPDPAPDLTQLNHCLDALATIFPNVQIHVFREMLASFDCESRLAVVADALLKNRVTWVKGRWRALDAAAAPDSPPDVPTKEHFRSPEYKEAVKALALHEFKGLSRSAAVAVLAEHNYSYLDARPTLIDISSKSWRYAFSNFFSRKKPAAPAPTVDATDSHPLVVWKSSGRGSILPTIRATGNSELDRELFDELVVPLQRKARATQEDKDRVLAIVLNMEEAEAANATHECACCFTDATFEEITTCNAAAHVVCFRCVQHSINEAVFGQGWQRSIDKDLGTLRCPAVDTDECTGCIPVDQLHRAMLEEKKGSEVLHRLDQRLAEHGLVASGLPLVRCPFCSYAEIDDLYVPPDQFALRIRAAGLVKFAFLLLCVIVIPLLLPAMLLTSLACVILTSRRAIGDGIKLEFCAALTRHRRNRRGLKFVCQSASCGRTSCLSCSKGWTDIHVCHESALVALRTQVEQAMSMAIKRVCPRCNTSFVKTAGCNKLTCPCGYKMCYVCRKDIGGSDDDEDVGYRHFCGHFRPEGDPRPCDQCSKCNLWEAENTEAVLLAARNEAERKWLEAEGRALNGAEKAIPEAEGSSSGATATAAGGHGIISRRRRLLGAASLPSLATVCDAVVENLFV